MLGWAAQASSEVMSILCSARPLRPLWLLPLLAASAKLLGVLAWWTLLPWCLSIASVEWPELDYEGAVASAGGLQDEALRPVVLGFLRTARSRSAAPRVASPGERVVVGFELSAERHCVCLGVGVGGLWNEYVSEYSSGQPGGNIDCVCPDSREVIGGVDRQS